MRLHKKFFTASFFALCLWHAWALFAQPLFSNGLSLPGSSVLRSYSTSLQLYPAWSFFSVLPEQALMLAYRNNAESTVFYAPNSSYFARLRYYRCGACATAAYQLLLRPAPPSGHAWIGEKLACALSDSKATQLELSLIDNPATHIFKTISLSCTDEIPNHE